MGLIKKIKKAYNAGCSKVRLYQECLEHKEIPIRLVKQSIMIGNKIEKYGRLEKRAYNLGLNKRY